MTSSFLEAIEDKIHDVAASWDQTSTARSSEYAPRGIESGSYSTGRMKGFGSDSASHCSGSGGGPSRSYDQRRAGHERDAERVHGESRATSGYAVPGRGYEKRDQTDLGVPKIESGNYSTGRMQGFGSDERRGDRPPPPSDRNGYDRGSHDRDRHARGTSGSFHTDLERSRGRSDRYAPEERTEIGAPKIETGHYSTGRMQGFGSDDLRKGGRPPPPPDRPAYGSVRDGSSRYASRDAYDRDERRDRERMSDLVNRSNELRGDLGRHGRDGGYEPRGGGGGYEQRSPYEQEPRRREPAEGFRRREERHDDCHSDDGHRAEDWTAQVERSGADDDERDGSSKFAGMKINVAPSKPAAPPPRHAPAP